MSDVAGFERGQTIIQEGTAGSFAYLIVSGSVEVSKNVGDEKLVLSRLVKGSIFGEMSLVDEKPRSATVVALEDTQVRVITREHFESMLERNPRAALPLLKQVFQRVRYLNQMVSAFCGQDSTRTLDQAVRPLRLTPLTDQAERAMQGNQLDITKMPFQIGRSTNDSVFGSNDLDLQDIEPYRISRCQCLITIVDNTYYLVDTVSSGGTSIDGTKIGGREAERRLALGKGKHRLVLGGEESPFVFELEIP
ncbi:MAG: cyclic nucleotide-binding domain-containing protein [Deltaproteobacteria bacterium]|nr:MAG: cyclic nucleotide-binding domain-containing protein [Deltaproteobacteria bacterium]